MQKSASQHNMIETIMGAVVLILAGFFIVFAYSNSTVSHEGGYKLYAKFERIDGLKVGSDVRMSGVRVGEISEVTIDPQTFLAKVEISMDPKFKLPNDSSAEVVSDGLLGSKYLALVPGGDEKIIKSGGLITRTQGSVSLESLIGKMIFDSKDSKDK